MSDIKTAVLGGGCFWCLEPVFSSLKGVVSVEPGYAGGHLKNPTYEDVCKGNTGHAEVVKIEFNPAIISFETILEVFFSMHDPTTLDRQGADIGDQYRSTILYADEGQKKLSERFIKKLKDEQMFNRPIVTKIEKLGDYYSAEDYHKDYYKNNRIRPYCQFIISPKLKKLKDRFPELLK